MTVFSPQNALTLAGKKVLITGATGGIGQALAHIFHESGADLILCGRNEETLNALKENYPQRCTIQCIDLSDKNNIEHAINSLLDAKQEPDILINNGGMTQDSWSFRMDNHQWQSVIDVNLTSAFMISRMATKSMMRKKEGRIINMTSIVGVTGNKGQANYCASKAGLIGMTKSMAQDLARWNITVNAIAPGYIDTPMTQGLPKEALIQRIPLARYGTPEEVAYAALFLSSPLASYITGQTIHINGGLAMI